MKILGPALLSLLTLAACSKPATAPPADSGSPGKVATPPLSTQMSEAAASPLNDLNLVRTKIPAVLLQAQRAPYAPPSDPTCDGLALEIRELDAVLGPDLDAPVPSAGPGLAEQGKSEAGDVAVGALRHTAEGLVPFRGWVRKLSGAERFSKQVLDATTAGIVRRAYLKGLGQGRGCPVVAVPQAVPGLVKDSVTH